MALAEDGKDNITIISVLLPTSTLFVLLRLIMRRRRGTLGPDDGFLCFGLLLAYLQYVYVIIGTGLTVFCSYRSSTD